MLLPPLLRPLPADGPAAALPTLPATPLTLVSAGSAPVGEILARMVSDRGLWDRCAWLRHPPRDARSTRRALIDSLGFRSGDGRQEEASSLAEAFRASAKGTVLVVELDRHGLCGGSPLVHEVKELAEQSGVSVVVASSGNGSRQTRRVVAARCALDASPLAVAAARAAGLDDEAIAHVRSRVRAGNAVLFDLAAASRRLSPELVRSAVMGPHRRQAYLRRLTALLLDECGEQEREALAVAVRTGYWHPQFSGGSVEIDALRPWMTPLEHDWGWIRPIWLAGLGQELHRPRGSSAVGVRSESGVPGEAIVADWPSVLDVRMLGGFEVRLDGRLVEDLGGQLAGSLLRYLVMRPFSSAHRDELIELFWPEADPQRARNRLQVAVSSLRKALRQVTELDVVEFHNGTYRINPDLEVVVDCREFEKLADATKMAARVGDHDAAAVPAHNAVRRYRGEFCSDLLYEEWTIFLRERMRMLYGDVLEELVEGQWSRGDYEGCIETAGKMLEEDPCREDAHRLLMRCFSALGRHQRALRQYEACRRILEATLSTRPSAATASAHARARDCAARDESG